MQSKITLLEKSCYPWYRIDKRFIHFIGKIKSIWERITKGYCYEDVWNLKDFYLEIFIHSLRDLAENHNSYPSDMTPDSWSTYLNEMANHFEHSKEELSSPNPFTYSTLKQELLNNNNEELSNVLTSWKDFEIKQAEWRKSEFKKGMKMLEERFNDLWD